MGPRILVCSTVLGRFWVKGKAPVLQKLDSTIYWRHVREANCAIQRIVIYPVDSAIYLLNNWGQMNKIAMPSPTRLGVEEWVNVSFP